MKIDTFKTDVLCVGGGIAGLMAAIHASESGLDVTVVDKANTVRSGCGATGCDHFRCYIPEVHGPDIEPMVESLLRSARGAMRTKVFARTWMERSFEVVRLWESWGIPMKYNGKYEFAGHGYPGRTLHSLKYSGRDQKPILAREAERRGVRIFNRVMVFDLIRNDGVAGAVGIDTRQDRMLVFSAKAVFLGTGLCTRLYPGPTPGWLFNLANSPNNTGDGRAMAYRAGAEIANPELTMQWAGPKSFARCGKGTWVGVLRDPQGKAIGPFVSRPDRRYGDVAADLWGTVFEDYAKSGKGPVYMDCRGISDEDFEYMMYWMRHEGNIALMDHLAEEEIDLKRDPIEFMSYEKVLSGGVHYNEKGETSVKGLYAAGDELYGALSCAATFGWIAGENAARYALNAKGPEAPEVDGPIGDKKHLIAEIRSRKRGATWQEASVALQQIMGDYVGVVRSETLLDAGLQHLRRLKGKTPSVLAAANPHELMRCLEVLNLMDLGEIVMIAAAERKESRGRHIRSDYPYTNPLMDRLLIVKKVDGRPACEWRPLRR
jgi:succinate dehydrogenase/fumarate reductase flavoprotein subunit